ncbi:Helix-turn-helix domain-containing protein [Nocardia amikacinitolerans]|uniref:Helix-turn-helix domain-containing protein n=1 Tax=Nocardia amikacinitolerans TaxID=756689 RepID=A0A285LW60_9NOCA|nr:helix-turn-helix domain-containing protein [Nocardia amikacinitolerans]MCP2295153.1 Helix-turn-helix domain-containing protein [Nocardia amikacinitolerans]SNY87581.1 Helix-turn-helix domain-containing protein [Nocardia amikacinitolerans]
MPDTKDIGQAIRTARRRHRLTQEQLAELAGTSTRTIREIEHGSGGTGIATVATVANVVGLTLGVTE